MPPQAPNALDRILLSLKLKKGEPALTREQAMQAWPVRNPALQVQENDEGLITIELPRRKDLMGGVLGFLFSVPQSRPVQLDEVGSFVWQHCDGENTVNDIVGALVSEYKLNRREVELSLTQYLQSLAKRGMVGFAVPRDVAEAAGLAGQALGIEAPGPAGAPEPDAPFAAHAAEEPAAEEAGPAEEDTSDLPPVSDETPAAAPAPPLEQTDDQEPTGRV